jgi:hypothetical protein
MAQTRTITLDSPTKKALVAAIAALCVCVIGALLVVGRGSGSTSFATAARAAGGTPPSGLGTTRGSQGSDQGDGQNGAGPGWGGQGNDGSRRSSFEEFRQCLQDQGVTLPDPRRGGRPTLSDTMRRAFEACRRYLPERPSGGPGFGDPGSGSAPFGTPPSGGGGRSDGQGSGDGTF